MRSVGYSTSRLRAAHVEWSPHFEGDAAVVSEDGSLQLFDLADAASCAHATQLRGTFATHRGLRRSCRRLTVCAQPGSQVCSADGAPFGWRGCIYGAHPRTLLCASAATVWLADARSPPPSAPRVVHLMAGGRPTAECFTALCSAEASGESFMFSAATGTRVLLFDMRRAHVPLLSWEHWLGADDPPRILSCQSVEPWMPAAATKSGGLLLACNLGRREAAAFQFSTVTKPGTADALGWASELLRMHVGVRAVNAGSRLPSAFARNDGIRDASLDPGCATLCQSIFASLLTRPVDAGIRAGTSPGRPPRALRCWHPTRVAQALRASCAAHLVLTAWPP